MLKQYLKQAWQLIRQNKLFSAIYVAGTVLGISMVMVLMLVLSFKTISVYPEQDNGRILFVKSAVMRPKTDKIGFWSSSISYEGLEKLFFSLETPEAVASEKYWSGSAYVSMPDGKSRVKITERSVDAAYWKVFNFTFIHGKPFTEADFQSGIHSVVITESLARKLFGTHEATGKTIEYNFDEYRIAGVVKDVSVVMSRTYTQLWRPYSCSEDYRKDSGHPSGLLGGYQVYILARSKKDFPAIKAEVNNRIRRYNSEFEDYEMDLLGQPDDVSTTSQRLSSNQPVNKTKTTLVYLGIIILLMLVPAVNLSGMNSSRMEKRLSEMGVRKAFGAARSRLLNQVLVENLLLTGLGGLAGLMLSYVIILLSRNWILDIGNRFASGMPQGVSVDFSISMLFNIKIFMIVLSVCFIMNILSAFIPVFRSLRKSITDSLHIKYN